MAEFYESPRVYIQSCTTIKDKIARIDALILATMDTMIDAATAEDTEEYQLNDGQTIIKVKRRSISQIQESVRSLEALKQMYVSDYEGHTTILVDHESTRRL